MHKTQLLSGTSRLVLNGPDDSAVTFDQHIPDSFLADIRRERLASNANRKDYQRVARIPVRVAEKWKREGFDVFKADAREIIAKLNKEDLGAFITTNKQV